MEAGKRLNVSIIVPEELKKCWVRIYVASPDGTQRMRISGDVADENRTLVISYVPSVFANGTKMDLVIESLQSDDCGFTASVTVNYTTPYTEPALISPANKHLGPTERDIRVQWTLQMDEIIDDGYSTSAAFTTVFPNSDGIYQRQFVRNTGEDIFTNAVPSTETFFLEVGPSSAALAAKFPLGSATIERELAPGPEFVIQAFRIAVLVCIILSPILLFACIICKFTPLCRRRDGTTVQISGQTSGLSAPMLGNALE
jgi:hypothetical protein